MSHQHGMGALPPPGMEWMMGKTVKEIEEIRQLSESTGKTLAEAATMKERIPLEMQLFSWESWDDEGPMAIQVYNVTLKVQIGEFPVGTKFPTAFVMGETSTLALYDEDGTEHAFALNMSAGEKLSTTKQDAQGGHCNCGHEH